MNRPPRKPSEPILSFKFGLQLAFISVTVAAGALAACHFGLRTGVEMAQTMALTTLVVLELIRVQIIRAQYHMSLFANRWLLFALVGSLALQLGVIYFSPLQKIFGTAPLGRMEWIVIVVIALLVGGVSHGISKLFQFPCRLKT